jgi:prepilin-type N-terminal cleavage/methylation domain-containing protein
MEKKERGFTLIELIIVLIIVGILGTLGLTQYTRLVEKSRGAEAKQILGSIRQLAAGYYMEWGSATGLTAPMVGIGADGAPATCPPSPSSHYFQYGILPGATSVIITATRCTGATGKPPGGSVPAETLTLTSPFNNVGTDAWGPATSPYL